MGKVIRRAVAVLLCATAVILAVLPAQGAEATSTHGDYEYDGATVAKYVGTDTEVTLPAWVNRVGKEAFENYDKMTKLVMTDTVSTVDFGAFSNCDNLATVKMGGNVRTLGSSAFSNCPNLYSVSVPASVRTIGSGVFAGCPSLSSVPVDAGNRNYVSHDGVLYTSDGKKLVQYLAGRPSTTYKMPRSIREIEEYAFWGANNLSKLSISYGVDKIPEYAFSNCKGLQHVTLPRSVQSIFAYAFEDCDSLSYINIPDSVGYIDDRAFANTVGAKIRLIDTNGNVVKTFNSEDVEAYGSGTGGATPVDRPDYDSATQDNTNNTNSTNNTNNSSSDGTGDGEGSDGSGTSSNTTGNTDTTGNTTQPGSENDNSGSTSNSGSADSGNDNNGSNTDNEIVDSNGNIYVPDDSYEGLTPPGSSFNPNDVTPLDPGDEDSMPASSGSDYQSTPDNPQTSAPSNIIVDNSDLYNNGYYKASDSGSDPWDTQIEYHNFEENMTPYDLGGGKIVGGEAVLKMSSKIPVKGFNFPNAEYEDTMMDTASMYPENKSDVIGDVFASYTGNEESVTVPKGVKKLGNRAFYKNQDVRNVELPKSISEIGEFAFARSGIDSISLPNGTTSIDYAAFYRCPNLTNVEIPGTVSSIALGAFDGTPYLENWKDTDDGNDFLVVGDNILLSYKGREKKLILPEGIKHIAPGAFSKNSSLESVIIPASVSDIGEEAFSDCTNLHELILQEGLKNIDDRAFKNSSIAAVSIPDSVEGIGLGAFDNGGKLKTVIFNGNNVPNVTYNKSATRLSAKDLRTRAFEGADNAIVSSDCNIDDGTLFAPRFYGFDGEVYSIASNENKTLILDRAMKQPDSAGNVVIDQQVDIAGQTYVLENVKSDAFDNYRNWSDWADNKPVNVSVNGEQGDTLKDLLAEVNSNVIGQATDNNSTVENMEGPAQENPETPETAGTTEPENTIKSNITVSVDGKRFPTRGAARASIPGDDDKYSLNVTEDDSVKEKINTAFLHDKGAIPDDYVPLSVDLYDKSGTVPIHKLGDSKLEVSLPVPSGMENDDGIGIACLDDNGELTQLSSNVTDNGNGKTIDFVTGHCSIYVIYSRTPKNITTDSDGSVIESYEDESAASAFMMSGTWKTLNQNVYGPVSVKWFIIVILAALAGILFIYDTAGKKKSKR